MGARVAIATLAVLAGCNGCQPEDTGNYIPNPDSDSDTDLACGDTDPVLEWVTIEAHGTLSNGEGTFPAILFTPHVTDADGDLHLFRVHVWWDDVLDSTVSTVGDPVIWDGAYGTNPCGISTYEPLSVLGITGQPPFETALEFGVIVYDAAGHPSNGGTPVVQTFTTPNANGEYN